MVWEETRFLLPQHTSRNRLRLLGLQRPEFKRDERGQWQWQGNPKLDTRELNSQSSRLGEWKTERWKSCCMDCMGLAYLLTSHYLDGENDCLP